MPERPDCCEATGSGTSSLYAYFTLPCLACWACQPCAHLTGMKQMTVRTPLTQQKAQAEAYRVLERLEEQLVCEQVHCQLLISEGVHTVGSTTGGCPDLRKQ